VEQQPADRGCTGDDAEVIVRRHRLGLID